ncbi:MAG: VOC family protein [Chthoniobacter sp.]
MPGKNRRGKTMTPHHAVPVFLVSNLVASLQHYQNILGFSHDFSFGDYAGVKLGNVGIHLTQSSERPIGKSTAYIFCDEVDSYCAEIKGKGAILRNEPQDWPYGMREFIALDPDGNQLAFGCDSEKA